jgi:hypothetical protein
MLRAWVINSSSKVYSRAEPLVGKTQVLLRVPI